MDELVLDHCRVEVTEGNITNQHIYITELLRKEGFLPADCFGESQASRGLGWKVRLDVDGLDAPVWSDIPCEAGSDRKPRKFFRERDWVPMFFARHGIHAGDHVVFEKLGDHHFRVKPETPSGFSQSDPNTVPPAFQGLANSLLEAHKADAATGCVFELESHLQEFMRRNWNNLPLGKEWELIAVEKAAGDVGRIDLLAKHRTERRWLVLELKRDQTSDETVGQVLRYMGWVKQHHAQPDDKVEGMVVAGGGDERIRYALMHVPNVSLMLYELAFTLRPA